MPRPFRLPLNLWVAILALLVATAVDASSPSWLTTGLLSLTAIFVTGAVVVELSL